MINEKLGAFMVRACTEAAGKLCDHARPGQHGRRRKASVFGYVKVPDHAIRGYARRPYYLVEGARELCHGDIIIFADDGL